MNRLLLVLVVVVAGVLGAGFYLRWFHVGSESAGGESTITFTVDKDKIRNDETKVMEKVHDLGHQVKDKVAGPTEKSKDATAPPVRPPENKE